jgi:hypothetical protein
MIFALDIKYSFTVSSAAYMKISDKMTSWLSKELQGPFFTSSNVANCLSIIHPHTSTNYSLIADSESPK